MFSAALHCYVLSGQATGSKSSLSFNFVPFRRLLILSSVMAIIANTVHAHGIRQSSVPFAILGRLFLGLANADILHRQFVVEFIPPSLIVAESARLFQCQVGGLVTGLFLGSLNELLPSRSVQYDVRSIQLSNWLMVILWTIQFSRILCGGRNPKDSRNNVYQTMHSGEMNQVEYLAVTGDSSDSSSASIEAPGPARLFHKSPETRARDNLVHRGAEEKLVSDVPGRSIRRVDTNSIRTATRRRGLRKVGTIAKRIRKLLSYNVALSVALALVVYTTFAQEILFTSCALITDKYFGWRGNVAGFFLGSLSVFILPIDLVCEQVARRYEERTTIKVCKWVG